MTDLLDGIGYAPTLVTLTADDWLVIEAVERAGGRPMLVGGCVRDPLLGVTGSKDIDIEVYDLTDAERLLAELQTVGRVDEVGKSYAVLKVKVGEQDYDVSLPRRDSKTGDGHRGFTVEVDAALSEVEATARRDLTINALLWNPRTGEVADHWGGLADLEARVLRHTSPAFTEDPLRVLRMVQFAARFGFTVAPETADLARSIVGTYGELAEERVWGEWRKVFVLGTDITAGFAALRATGWDRHYPELQAVWDVPQDPAWHPEGNVGVHLGLAADAAAQAADAAGLTGDDRAVIVAAAAFHDLGKATHTQVAERITSNGHAEAGVEPVLSLLRRIGAPREFGYLIAPIVREHMCVHSIPGTPSTTTVRRLARRLAPASVDQWSMVCGADMAGRGEGAKPNSTLPWAAIARTLGVEREPVKLVLKGEDLMALGYRPGPGFRPVMDAALVAQDAGEFADHAEAVAWLAAREEDGSVADWMTKAAKN
jgi:tRNA nucleotidyltransferase (CCA-adding enzyme)